MLLEHTIRRVVNEYHALEAAIKEQRLQLPQTPHQGDSQSTFISADKVLGSDRTCHVRPGVPGKPMTLLGSIQTLEQRVPPLRWAQIGGSASLSLLVYLWAQGMSRELGLVGSLLLVLVPMLVCCLFLYRPLRPFLNLKVTGSDGFTRTGRALLKQQLAHSSIARGYMAAGVVGAGLLAGFPSAIVAIVGLGIGVWFSRTPAFRRDASTKPGAFSGRLYQILAVAAVLTVAIGAVYVPAADTPLDHRYDHLFRSVFAFSSSYPIPLFVLYLAPFLFGARCVAANVAIEDALSFREEMLYWAKSELARHGKSATAELAQQLLTEHRDVAQAEFHDDFEIAHVLPEFVELAGHLPEKSRRSVVRRTHTRHQTLATTLHSAPISTPGIKNEMIQFHRLDTRPISFAYDLALLFTVAPLFVMAAFEGKNAATRKMLSDHVKSVGKQVRAVNEADAFARMYGAPAAEEEAERGLDVVK